MKNILNVRWRPWTSCYCRNLDQKEWRVQFVKYLQLNSISFFISFFVTAKLVEVVFKIWFPSRHWWRHLWTSPIVACCCYIGKIRPLSVAQYLISVKLFLRLLICSNTTPPSLPSSHSLFEKISFFKRLTKLILWQVFRGRGERAHALVLPALRFSSLLSLLLDYDRLTNELSGELARCQTSFGVGW